MLNSCSTELSMKTVLKPLALVSADLPAPDLIHAEGVNLFNRKRGSVHYHPRQKYCLKRRRIASNPAIHLSFVTFCKVGHYRKEKKFSTFKQIAFPVHNAIRKKRCFRQSVIMINLLTSRPRSAIGRVPDS